MRGSISIYQSFVSKNNRTGSKIKGRCKNKITRRNLALVYRYFYYLTKTHNRYEIIIDILAEDFFLRPGTVSRTIIQNVELLKDLKNNNPSLNDYKKLFPMFRWEKL